MHITFVGTSSWTPAIGCETASFVINDRHLVDTGWCTPLRMRQYDLDPLGLESVILTHLHQDHYLGLAPLLFYFGSRGPRRPAAPPLRIIGPGDHLREVLSAVFDFLQLPRFPELWVDYTLMELQAGDRFELDDLRVETCAANHVSGKGRPEPALAYRVTESATGAAFAFSGDTSFHPPLARFAEGVPVLIHDATHASGSEAATIAEMAGAQRLLLMHYSSSGAELLLAAAREIFPESYLAGEGDTITIAGEAGT